MESSGAILVKAARVLPDYKSCVVEKGEAKRWVQIDPSTALNAAEAGEWMADHGRKDLDAGKCTPTSPNTSADAASETRRGNPWTIGRLSVGSASSKRRAADGVWNP